jgi:hypothetical protein
MGIAQNVSFNEAELTGIRQGADGAVCLLLEGVQVDDHLRNAAVHFESVSGILRDGAPVDSIIMEHDDGEVLALEKTPEFVRLAWIIHEVSSQKSKDALKG